MIERDGEGERAVSGRQGDWEGVSEWVKEEGFVFMLIDQGGGNATT
jgi:hypothetical protein